MCHSCIENNNVNSLHEMCLRIIYISKQFSFHGLLDRTSSVSLHKGNPFFHCNIELWNRIESLISVPPLNFFQKIFQPLSLLLGKSQTTFLSCLFLFNCILCNVFISIKKLRKLPAFSTFHYTGISRIGFCETLKIFQKFLVTNFSGLTTVIYPRSTQKLFVWKLERNIQFFQRDHNCVKNARMQIFADLYFLV